MPRYETSNLTTTGPLCRSSMGFHMELGIENYTAEPILVLRPGGYFYTVAPMFNLESAISRVVCKMIITNDVPNERLPLKQIPELVVTVKYDQLSYGPVVIPELGIMIGLSRHASLMKENNYLDSDYVNRKIAQQVEDYFKNPTLGSPIVGIINSHDIGLDNFYMVVNDTILKFGITHDLAREECLEIWMQMYDGFHKFNITDYDWSKSSCNTLPMNNKNWIVGTNLEAVAKALKERQALDASKMLRSDADLKIEQATKDLTDQVNTLTAQLEATKKELEITKKDLSNTKIELERANDGARASYEQQNLAQKLAILQADRANTEAKNQFAMMQAQTAASQQFQKAQLDLAVAETKVAKEKISMAAAESTNTATVVKAASIIVPVIASLGYWVAKTAGGSAAAAMGGAVGLGAIFPPLGVAIGMLGAAKLLWRPVVSVVKNTCNCVRNAIADFWDWLWD